MSDHGRLQALIESAYEERTALSPENVSRELRGAVETSIEELDAGRLRVAEKRDGAWHVNQWLKKAVLLSFRIAPNAPASAGPIQFYDKVPLKYSAWTEAHFAAAGVRVVPPATVRRGAFVARNAVLMPSYVNIGAYVGADTMVDTWATVGSCAQIGERVHLSGGVGIGGVLEPPNARPVVIEDEVLIGSRSMVTQGARVGKGAVLGEGTILNPSIPVIDAWSGDELGRGYVPPWSVAVGAMRRKEYPGGEFFLPCVLVVRHLTPGERHDKAMLNGILREHGASA